MSSHAGLVARHAVGRGDLVRLLVAEKVDPELAAELAGFATREPRVAPEALPLPDAARRPQERAGEATPADRPVPASAQIWRVAHQEWFPEALAGSAGPSLPEALARVDPLEDVQLRARSLARPRVPYLAPWRRLAPALRAMLSRPVESSRIDERRLVARCARLEPLHRLPRKTRRRWAPRLQVMWDRAEVLAGFSDDQRSVIRWLWQWRGPVGLGIVGVDVDGGLRLVRGRAPKLGAPPPGATVLALTDLGCLQQDISRRDWWVTFGSTLRSRGVRAHALALAPARRWVRPVERAWDLAPWERVRPHGRGAGEPGRAGASEAALCERLLNLLSVSARIDTAVLRAVRQLVAGADLGVESDARHHRDVVFRSEHGIVLDPNVLSDRRQAFGDEPRRLREQVAAALSQCHQTLAPCLVHEELLLAGSDAEREAALTFFSGLARRVDERGVREPGFLVDSYITRWQSRRDEACWAHDELAALWALAHRTDDGRSFDRPPPIGLRPSRVAWALRRREEVRWWRARQRGGSIVISLVSAPDAPLAPGDGFLLGHLPSRTGFLCVRTDGAGAARVLPLSSEREAFPLPRRGRVMIESDGGVLELHSTARPRWARSIVRRPLSDAAWLSAEGLGVVPWPTWARNILRDDHGVVAELELARGVVLRLRWIPPGTFLMGSPADEAGRWGDEGPQREVELTKGYWLGETVCTQEQWVAVMGSNPSEHKGDRHPVENVSWEDCQQYCSRLSGRFPGLGMRLPTEAEWEHACRAGTTGAFNDGSPCTEPGGKDPALDRLGWYGGNSGNETHPVAHKRANAWGLHDMHGNVWEWCADWWQGDYEGARTADPAGPPEGRRRVVRGGCYWDFARYCRSADRFRGLPGVRFSLQGFRPAAGHAVSTRAPEGVEETVGRPSAGGEEGGTTDGRRARPREGARTRVGER